MESRSKKDNKLETNFSKKTSEEKTKYIRIKRHSNRDTLFSSKQSPDDKKFTPTTPSSHSMSDFRKAEYEKIKALLDKKTLQKAFEAYVSTKPNNKPTAKNVLIKAYNTLAPTIEAYDDVVLENEEDTQYEGTEATLSDFLHTVDDCIKKLNIPNENDLHAQRAFSKAYTQFILEFEKLSIMREMPKSACVIL